MVSPYMTNPFAGLQQGMQAAGGLIDMYNAPKDRAFAMEQARQKMALQQGQLAQGAQQLEQGQQRLDLASREQSRLDAVQQQEQEKYRGAVFGALAKYAKDLPMEERRKVAGALQQMIPGINLDDEALSDERLDAASKAAEILSPTAKTKDWDFKVVDGTLFKTNQRTGTFEQISISSPLNKPENMDNETWETVQYMAPKDQANILKEFLKPSTLQKQEKLTTAKINAKKKALDDSRLALNAADKALSNIGWLTTGTPGRIASFFAASGRKDLEGALSSLKSVITQDTLQAMREASPTGGALGNVTEKELPIIQDKLASLDVDQKPETLEQNIKEIMNRFNKVRAITLGKVAEPITEADYNALPSGAYFINPETGELMRK